MQDLPFLFCLDYLPSFPVFCFSLSWLFCRILRLWCLFLSHSILSPSRARGRRFSVGHFLLRCQFSNHFLVIVFSPFSSLVLFYFLPLYLRISSYHVQFLIDFLSLRRRAAVISHQLVELFFVFAFWSSDVDAIDLMCFDVIFFTLKLQHDFAGDHLMIFTATRNICICYKYHYHSSFWNLELKSII